MTCRICAAELPPGAMFCGECGSSTTATPESRRRPDPRPQDTTVLGRVRRPHSTGVISIPVPFEQPGGEPIEEAPGDPLSAGAASADVVLDGPAEREHSPLSVAAQPTPAAPDLPPVPETGERDRDAAWWVVRGSDHGRSAEPVGGRPVDAPADSASRVLRFSTGETVNVTGTGLVGRRPLPQPGEYVDQLVRIDDRTLSVSKTHLEFGLHDGGLWIADRYSGNGTIIRRPDEAAMRCEPGRRYLVPAGSRVELAEQFFVVD